MIETKNRFTYFLEKAWTDDNHLQSTNGSNTINRGIGQRAMGPAYTFILPDLFQFPDGFRQFLEKDMIEMSTLRRLEQSGLLNKLINFVFIVVF